MKSSHYFSLLPLMLIIFSACKGQTSNITKTVQPGENQSAQPAVISAVDFSAGWSEDGQKILLTGTVFQPDGKTPAPGVVIYYYQTNKEGRYLHKPEVKRSMPPNASGQTHGYIRGWVKTDSNGRYFIYTIRPGVYPNSDTHAHIHATIKEPNEIKEYYIDEFVFDDDKLLTSSYRKRMENRCGSGVLRLVKKDTLFIGERNIYLGLNIPDYPVKKNTAWEPRGKNIGEDMISFTPFHAWGPDKDSKDGPVYKYGHYHGILYFAGNKPV